MQLTLIITQVLHVLSGVFWAGSTFALAHIGGNQAGRLFGPQMGAATLAIATGALLWFLLHRGGGGIQEQVLGVGAIFALIAAGVQTMAAIHSRRIAGGAGEMEQALIYHHGSTAQRVAAACLLITVICMAASRYI